MGKRFRETNISREAWYRKLTPLYKCAWNFLCDECDHAGVWAIDIDALEFYIGEQVDMDKLIEIVNKDKVRLEKFGTDKLFIPGFIEFQYGQLSENCKPHQKIISLLKKYKLFERVCEPYTKGTGTLQDKEEDKEEVKDKDEKGGGEKHKSKTKVRVIRDESNTEHKADYATLLSEISEEPDVKVSWLKIKEFIENRKPLFPDPYADLWNIFASRNNLAQVNEITAKRKEKMKYRLREPSFEFIKILESIRKSDFYLGRLNGNSNWKIDFDFIINSQDNYIRILEKKD